MEKLQATIVLVLSILDRPLYRTEIVKFTYMIDEMYYRHFGRSITGVSYKWDNFGPNSVDRSIVNEAETLAKTGIVRRSMEPNQYGNVSYLYRIKGSADKYINVLSEEEKYVIKNIVCKYRKYSLPRLIKASKETVSFKGVEQYHPIVLRRSERYQQVTESLRNDKEFAEAIEAAETQLVS